MGYGFPAAIGAKVGCPDRTVIDIDGDGSFLMTSYELATVARYGIPVKVAILRNNYLGMVKQWQDLFYGRRYSATELVNPDFAALARAFGVKALRCDRKEDVGRVVSEMLQEEGPVLVDFEVDRDEHVYPMVPAGKSLDEMEFGTPA